MARKWCGRAHAAERRAKDRVMRHRGIRPARPHWAVLVEMGAASIPEWAENLRMKGMPTEAGKIWLRGRMLAARVVPRLQAHDAKFGGKVLVTHFEYRACTVCGRIMLGLEAVDRRQRDTSSPDGRQQPCGPDCNPGTPRRRT